MEKENFADLLLKLGSKESTQEDYDYLLNVVPPIITNYTEEEGFNAFLCSEAVDSKFCKIAKEEVWIYRGYCTASNGAVFEILMSLEAFKHYF